MRQSDRHMDLKRTAKPGRPATRTDKNGRPMPVRADRDRPINWLFALLRHHPDFGEVLQFSGDERFFRLYDALHDDAYRNTSPGTLCRRFGVSLQDLVDVWREYNSLLGQMYMATQLSQIMEDVTNNAL